jgi:hypothetical protein
VAVLRKYEAPATQGKSRMGAGASWLRAAGGDSTCAGRVTASQRGRVAEIQFNKEPLGVERLVRRPAQLLFYDARCARNLTVVVNKMRSRFALISR